MLIRLRAPRCNSRAALRTRRLSIEYIGEPGVRLLRMNAEFTRRRIHDYDICATRLIFSQLGRRKETNLNIELDYAHGQEATSSDIIKDTTPLQRWLVSGFADDADAHGPMTTSSQ